MTYRTSPFRTDHRGLLGPAGPIGPAFSDDLIRMLLGTFHQEDDDEPTPHDLTKWGGALTAMEAFQPRTAIEAMLAAQAIATHHAIMECYFRAMQRDIPEELAIRVRSNAVGLTRAMDVNLRMLGRLQARPVPPPLPDVPAAVDAVLDLELERARRRARAAMERTEAAEAGDERVAAMQSARAGDPAAAGSRAAGVPTETAAMDGADPARNTAAGAPAEAAAMEGADPAGNTAAGAKPAETAAMGGADPGNTPAGAEPAAAAAMEGADPGNAPAGASPASAMAEDPANPMPEPMRPAIVMPRLEPHPPLDKSIMQARIAALHQEINERLDRERGGTPQEWYARQREEVRLKEAAEAAAKAAAAEGAETEQP